MSDNIVKTKITRKAPGSYHHGDLRETLIRAVIADLDRHGLEAINLTAVAKKLRVSQPSVYRHFANRNELLSAVAIVGFRELITVMQDASAAAAPTLRPLRAIEAYVDFGGRRNGLYRLMFASHVTTMADGESELFEISQESFRVFLNTFAGEPMHLRTRRALKIWVGAHGIVMLRSQGLLQSGITGTKADQLLLDVVGLSEL
jgi:AcrR family transcriptional regulator